METSTIRLSQLPRLLRTRFQRGATYRKLYNLVLDGVIPAEKDSAGREWLIKEGDLLKIAETLEPIVSNDNTSKK